MSTRHDRNFRSFDSEEQIDFSDVILDPIAAGWTKGSWSDTAKFYKRKNRVFNNFIIVLGGAEDCVDAGNANINNIFKHFTVTAGGKYVLTLKGGSSNNFFSYWIIKKPGTIVDIEIGNWSSYNFEKSQNNIFQSWVRTDNKPVTYCNRLGCKPKFKNMKVKHLWWRSIGITVYWWAKYFIHKILKVSDK